MMRSKAFLFLRALALALPLGCSAPSVDPAVGSGGNRSGNSEPSAEAERFVPSNLPNTLRAGDAPSGLTLIAFTLLQNGARAELYAAVKNQGPTPACEAGMLTDFFDKAGQLVSSVGSVLLSRQFYQLSSGELIACIDPGQIAMSASTSESIAVAELGSLQHAFPAFTVDSIAPVAGLSVRDVKAFATGAGRAYAGTVNNESQLTASMPQITVFPVNRVGRPLGAATSNASTRIAPGGTWAFETDAIDSLGVDFAAFARASLAN
jgi:hypothetical protein